MKLSMKSPNIVLVFVVLILILANVAGYVGAKLGANQQAADDANNDERHEQHRRAVNALDIRSAKTNDRVGELTAKNRNLTERNRDLIDMLWRQTRHAHMPDGGCIGAGCNGHCLVHDQEKECQK